jgi:hypothetical protein
MHAFNFRNRPRWHPRHRRSERVVARGAPAFMTIELAAAALFPFPLRL